MFFLFLFFLNYLLLANKGLLDALPAVMSAAEQKDKLLLVSARENLLYLKELNCQVELSKLWSCNTVEAQSSPPT